MAWVSHFNILKLKQKVNFSNKASITTCCDIQKQLAVPSFETNYTARVLKCRLVYDQENLQSFFFGNPLLLLFNIYNLNLNFFLVVLVN